MIHLLTSAAIVGSPACQFVYFPAANTLNLINDAGTELVSPTGIVPGQPGSLTNARCSANVAATSRMLGSEHGDAHAAGNLQACVRRTEARIRKRV